MTSAEICTTASHVRLGARLSLFFQASRMIGSGRTDDLILKACGISEVELQGLRYTLSRFAKRMRYKNGNAYVGSDYLDSLSDASHVLTDKITDAGWERMIAHAACEPTALARLIDRPPIHPVEASSLITRNGQLVFNRDHEAHLVGAICEIFAIPPSQYVLVVRTPEGKRKAEVRRRFADLLLESGLPREPEAYCGHGKPYQLEGKQIHAYHSYGHSEGATWSTTEFRSLDYVALILGRGAHATIRSRLELVTVTAVVAAFHQVISRQHGFHTAFHGVVDPDVPLYDPSR